MVRRASVAVVVVVVAVIEAVPTAMQANTPVQAVVDDLLGGDIEAAARVD